MSAFAAEAAALMTGGSAGSSLLSITARPSLADVFGYLLWLVWRCVRLPLLLFLGIIEPVVSFVLGSLALLGILLTLFWWSVGPPHFPLALMLGVSLGLGATRIAYHALLRLLNGR